MEKEKDENENNLFCSLPRVLREEILLYLGDFEEISRVRVICKRLKDTVDNSSREKLEEIKRRRNLFEEEKRKRERERRETELRLEEERKERLARNQVSFLFSNFIQFF